jgi:hypothetical protein
MQCVRYIFISLFIANHQIDVVFNIKVYQQKDIRNCHPITRIRNVGYVMIISYRNLEICIHAVSFEMNIIDVILAARSNKL